MRYARVLWTDAAHMEELAPGENGGPIDGLACGIVVEDEDSHITLALEAFEDGDYRKLLSIARPMVREVEYLAPVLRLDE